MKLPKTTIATDWRVAKREAVHVGNQIGAHVLQGPNDEKIVLFAGKRRDFNTWYAAYSFVFQIWFDQNSAKNKEPEIPVAEVWTGPLPAGTTRAKTALIID